MDTTRTANAENSGSPPDIILNSNQDRVKEIIVKELERKSSGSVWLWVLFILCATPNVIGGLNISFYLFISQPPENFHCIIGELANAGWTREQMRDILAVGKKACNIPNWNYSAIAGYGYETVVSNRNNWDILNILEPSQEYIPCLSQASNYYEYIQIAGTSIVTEWDLICENTVWLSTVQAAQSFGRVIGSPIVGIFADKYGRKLMFNWSSIIMIISGIVATFTPCYSLLLVGRFGIGFASQGVLYPLQILATENADMKHRTAISCIINMTYAFGVILLAVIAIFITTWRQLSLAVSLPALILLFNMYYLVESPRWLLTKGRIIEAYAAVFRSQIPTELLSTLKKDQSMSTSENTELSIMQKIKIIFNDMIFLYKIQKWRKLILVCHVIWFITLLCYYVTVLNAHNQSTNIYVYTIGIGVIDIFGDLLAIYITRNCGRKSSSYLLFILTSFFLLIVLCFPKNYSVYFGVFSRLCIICLYSIISLHMIEMFPTSCRIHAIGLTSFFSNFGTIIAPYVVDLLGPIAWWIPNAVCGVSTIIAAFASLLLPETKSEELEDHLVN